MLTEGINLKSDLVKVAHHGSKTSSIEAFVAATRPSLAIISVGRTSMFGHPNRDVVKRWRASGAEVITTGEKGTISVVTDGKFQPAGMLLPLDAHYVQGERFRMQAAASQPVQKRLWQHHSDCLSQ